MPSADDARRESVVGDVDFPPTSGTATGWVGLLLVAVGIYLVVSQASGVASVRGVLVLLLVGVLVHAFLMRPRVRIADDHLVLVNPLRTVSVPLQLVRSVVVRSVTKVRLEDGSYTGVGVGRTLREMSRGSGDGAGGVSSATRGFMGTSITGGSAQFMTPMGTRRGTADVADIVEDTVARAVLQVRDARKDHEPPAVRRSWALPEVVPTVVLVVGLLVTLAL